MKHYLNGGPYRGILFDIDNTLYRNDGYVAAQIGGVIACYAAWSGQSEEQAREQVEARRAEITVISGGRPSLGTTLIELGVPRELNVQWRRRTIEPALHLRADGALRRSLLALRDHFPLAALTNNPSDVGMRTLEVLGVADLFVGVVGLETTGFSKPDWRPFAAALSLIEVSVEEIVMVGDRYDVDLGPIVTRGGSAVLVSSTTDIAHLAPILSGAERDE